MGPDPSQAQHGAGGGGALPKRGYGALPREYVMLSIGIKNDHIFQGIIYGQPRDPLMLRAINHAFSKSVLSKVANLEYMIFCKELWRLLGTDLGHAPQVGWNQSKRFGPIYLLEELEPRAA